MIQTSRPRFATGAALILSCATGLFATNLPAQQGSYTTFGSGCGPTAPVTGFRAT